MSPSRFTAWSVMGGVVLSPAIVFCGAAVWFLWAGYTAGPLQTIDISASLTAHPSGAYVDLAGAARSGLMVDIDRKRFPGPPITYTYIPLFADLTRHGTESPIVIRMFRDDAAPIMRDADAGRTSRVRGVLHAGVKGYARSPLVELGALLSPGAMTLDATESPEDDIQFGWMIGAAGLMLQAIVLGLMWWLSRD